MINSIEYYYYYICIHNTHQHTAIFRFRRQGFSLFISRKMMMLSHNVQIKEKSMKKKSLLLLMEISTKATKLIIMIDIFGAGNELWSC